MAKKLTATVVGGGISGMTAALVLARFGHEVTLVERSPELGRTVRGFYRQGVYFDTGFHSSGGLGENKPFSRYLNFLGLGGLPVTPFQHEGFDTIRFGSEDRILRLNTGYGAFWEGLIELFPGDAKGIGIFLDALRKVYDNAPFLRQATDIRAEFAEEAEYDTLAVFLQRTIRDPLLRATLSVASLLHGAPPGDVSFLQHARVLASRIDEAATFEGGGAALADAFAHRLEESGVRVITGNGVSRINISSAGSVEGITLDDGNMYDADTVVYTGHPFFMFDLVHEGVFTPAFARQMQKPAETPSAYMLFGVSDTPILPDGGSNLFYCPDTDLSRVFSAGHDPLSGPFYVATRPGTGLPARGMKDSSASGPHTVMAIMAGDFAAFERWKDTPPGQRGAEYAAIKTEKLDRFREALAKAWPQTASVHFFEGATPLTLRDFTRSPAGSVYGRKHTLAMSNPQPATRVPGLWLAGQSIVAPGVLGAVISAFLACGFIVGSENLHAELNR